MNIDNHMCNAKTCLKTSQAKIEARDYETAFAMLSEAKADIDKLMEYVYALKVAASANEMRLLHTLPDSLAVMVQLISR